MIVAATSSSATLSLITFGMVWVPISAGSAFGFTLTNEILYEQTMHNMKTNLRELNKLSTFLVNFLQNFARQCDL